MRVPTTVVALAVIGTACSDATAPADMFTARIEGDSIVLFNGTTEPVHHVLTDVANLAESFILLCNGPECPAIGPGTGETHAVADAGLPPGTAFVHWWHAEPDGEGGFRPDRIRTIELEL